MASWTTFGAVHFSTNDASPPILFALIGPGNGSLSQRVRTGSGNDFTVSATIRGQLTNDWLFVIRFLDKESREVMRVDSLNDIAIPKGTPIKLSHYMKAHPLTEWIELVISNYSSTATVRVDQVRLDMADENAASLQPTCDLAETMQPFWLGKKVHDEAVLMLSENNKPATGQLLFRPSRILSVRDYGLHTNYVQGVDYTVSNRALVCTANSRMSWLRQEDLPKGELKWSTPGGRQIMVTYEREDLSIVSQPAFASDGLPNTIAKLKGHSPLRVVAYGDSITHGVGVSRLSHLPPFMPPWPELFVERLTQVYQNDRIQLFNSAQSGADSAWGRKYADRMVGMLNPDLVIIAFGQNDFWRISADAFEQNIVQIMKSVRSQAPKAEFLLVSPMRFDPDYSSNRGYWTLVLEYASRLKGLTGPGIQFVDMTAISERLYAAKKPKDCLNDPLHPNDYLARWYAQAAAAVLDPSSGQRAAAVPDRRPLQSSIPSGADKTRSAP